MTSRSIRSAPTFPRRRTATSSRPTCRASSKEDIHIDIDDDILSIQAEHKDSKGEKDDKGDYIRRERYYGSYSRSFNVSEIDVEGIKAAYENGVLTLTMPKKAPAKPESKHLEIE